MTASPATADTRPADTATPVTVSADALPTVQVDGVVWSQVVVGRTVYAAGEFTTVRPAGAAPGTSTVARYNLLAYDIETGALVTGFAPRLNGPALSITRSPDGTRIYVVGDFTQVDGQWRVRAAAFDTATGALVASFRPTLSSRALTVAATSGTVYVGGNFTSAASVTGGTLQPRSRLAAFAASNGELRPFRADADQPVTALAVTADASKVVVGGRFTALAGSAAIGLAAVSPTSGARLSFPAAQYIRNSGAKSSITSLYADASGVYGTGYHMSKTGNLEGSFRAHASTGELIWVADCHGDAYSVFPQGDVVYTSSHAHYCANVPGGFPQSEPWQFFHANAFTKNATGVNTKDIYGYPDHPGEPAPTQLYFYPQFSIGTYTGQNQATWSVTGNDRYVVMGGEFPAVNGQRQQGLVRFARPDVAPNKQGPRLSGAALNPRLSSFAKGTVRVSWPAAWDRDNMTLTYRVYRGSQSQPPVHVRTVTAPFWYQPSPGFTDSGLTPGSTQQYRVTATDPFGNVTQSQWVSVTVAGSGEVSPYVTAVLADAPTAWWRLGEPSGTTIRDWAGLNDATASSGVTRGAAGAVAGDAASSFNGTSTGSAASTKPGFVPPSVSIEAWVRTTSTAGGKLVGFGNKATGASTSYDRHIYMDNAGRLWFGVYPGAVRTISSTASYNDGRWHHVVATLGANGMQLFVDGVRVASRTDTTSGQPRYGHWRVGGDNLGGWTSRPSSDYLNGTLDEVAIYPTVLPADVIAKHHAAATATTTAPTANQAPVASFTSSVSGLGLAVDGSGSSDADGTIAAHAWDFGDGRTATGVTASHTYAAAGTYTVRLTVTDDGGATGTTTRQVTVTAPAPTTGELARDAFSREVTSGWGTADVGGAWSVSSTSASAVTTGVGRQRVPQAGSTVAAYLTGVSSTATDLQVTVALDKPQTGGGTYVSVVGRRVSTATYSARLRFLSTGAVTLQAMNGGTALQQVTVPGLTYAPGERLRVRVRVAGTSPTTLQAKVWRVGATEPTGWQVNVTDSTAALQSAGHVGAVSYLSGSATNAPMTVSYDDLAATPAQ